MARRGLVLGGGGWTGRVLVGLLQERGIQPLAPPRAGLDLGREPDVTRRVREFAPDVVINLAAAQPGTPSDLLEATNVRGAEALARAAQDLGVRLIHVASDAGLDGQDAPYADDAPMRPLTPYGRSKAEGERRVLAAHPGALSVRTSLLWDPEEMDRGTAGFAARLEAGQECRLFVDEIRCPLPRRELAAALVDLIELPVCGSLNVAGREAISRHDFGLLLLRHFGVRGLDRVEAVRAAELEAAGAPPRPRDLRLDVRRAEGLLGRRLPGVRETLGVP
jgi:dTDP-4-dehydrorhamnose reductase